MIPFGGEVKFEFRSRRLLRGIMEVGLCPMIYFPSEVTFCEVLRSLLPYEVFWTIVSLKQVRILERNRKPNMSVVKASIMIDQ